MIKRLNIPVLLIFMALSPPVFADPELIRLAEQGDRDAQYNLGVTYSKGEGVPQDYKAAVKWFTFAAEKGLAEAQYNLGVMYRLGAGVILDNVYAHMWFNIAGSNGVESAAAARDAVANRLTKADLTRAQDLARNCVRKEYKGC